MSAVFATENFTLYATVTDVEQYAKRHGKSWWLDSEEDEQKDFLERASNMVHDAHKQRQLWKHSELQFPCILQAVHIAKYAISADIGEHANNAGGWNDGIMNASGGNQTWDNYAKRLIDNIIDAAGLIVGETWDRG